MHHPTVGIYVLEVGGTELRSSALTNLIALIFQVPSRREGTTEIIASERGHLSTGVPRSRTSPWGTYVGTWDMPNKLPGNFIIIVFSGQKVKCYSMCIP